MTQHTVLIVEDEKDIRELLAYTLRQEGFAVLESGNGTQALELARKKLPDIILLDLMLPGMDGLSVSKALQREAKTAAIPVLMLTARGEEIDRIVGLELGAADYVVKPFSVREVVLRIRAILRRHVAAPDEPLLCCGVIVLHLQAHTATVRGQKVDLTLTEFRLLADLLRNKGRVRTREQLLDTVWGYSFDGYARTVDTHIRRLRAKLADEAERIETVRGVGYRANDAQDAEPERQTQGK
ncbi:response regulator transcription factor [Desulfosarcina sp. OttesenSCG-928-G10]|nr:response regulator transcription factor [Desulfosarcina sp. OttesenSCG-928-G10]